MTQELEVRVSNHEIMINELKQDIKDLSKDVSNQEARFEKKIDEKFKELKAELSQNHVAQGIKSDNMITMIDEIKNSSHASHIADLELRNSINLVLKDFEAEKKLRDSEAKERNKLKWSLYTMGLGLIGAWLKISIGV